MNVRPVGHLPTSVYWRRRLLVLLPVLVLVGAVAYACAPDGGTTPAAADRPAPSAAATTTAPAPTVPTCAAGAVGVTATATAPSFPLGTSPTLGLVATNVGTVTCALDVADPQVVLTVYLGTERVWGSHDCAVQAGTNLTTLAPAESVAVALTWAGTTSTPGCATPRVAAAAGTYTLQATLGSTVGTAATFALT